MGKEIKRQFIWKLLKILPLGLRLKIASKYDDRIKNMLDFYGDAFQKNTDWRGNVNIFGAIIEEEDKEKQDRLIKTWKRVKYK